MTGVKNILCRVCGRYLASGGIEVRMDDELVKLCCEHCADKYRQQKQCLQDRGRHG